MNKKIVFCVILILFLAETVLLSPNSRAVHPAIQGATNPPLNSIVSSYDNVTTHEGDLVIGGYQSVLIENCTYLVQEGTVTVRDSAILKLRNVQLEFNESYRFPNAYLLITDQAFASIQNVTMDSNFGVLVTISSTASTNISGLASLSNRDIGIILSDEATLNISNSTSSQIWLNGGSKASIAGSDISCISPIFDQHSEVEVVGMQPGLYGYWKLWENSTISGVSRPSFELTIENTVIESWLLQLDAAASVTVQNSTMGLILGINENLQLSNMHPGNCDNWNLNRLRLQNCFVSDVTYYIADSIATVSNCTGWSGLVAQGASQVTVQSSEIGWIKLYEHVGSLTFDQVNFTPNFNSICFYDSSTSITGDFNTLDFNASYDVGAWVSTKITRNYNVITKTASGNQPENVGLSLVDQNSTVVWSGQTDNLGHATFSLCFADNNYTNTLKLEATSGNLFGTANVSLFSNTPLVLTVGLHDVAMADVGPAKTVVGLGYSFPVNVTVANQGDFAENTNITLYANSTLVGTQALSLSNGSSSTVRVTCSTAGFSYGNYSIWVCLSPVPHEANTANNNCTGGSITVTVPGDIDGNFAVQLNDLVLLARAYGSKPSDSNWNPNADIDGNGIVGLSDLVTLAQHYGQHYP